MKNTTVKYLRSFWLAARRLYVEQYTYRASALAFMSLLAVVPSVTVILSIIAVFPLFARFSHLAQTYIFTNFIPESSQQVQIYFENFINQATRLPTFGIIFLVFTVFSLILMVEHTLNSIWEAPKRTAKLTTMFIYWLVLLLMPVLLGLSLFISSFVFSLSWFAGLANKIGLMKPLLIGLPLVINTFMFSALYTVVPNSNVRISDGLMGGLVASLLFEAAKKGFGFYIKNFPSYELIYGTLATIPIFLIWVYISWLVILYGALFTHQVSRQKH